MLKYLIAPRGDTVLVSWFNRTVAKKQIKVYIRRTSFMIYFAVVACIALVLPITYSVALAQAFVFAQGSASDVSLS